MSLRYILWSWDLASGVVAGIAGLFFLPNWVGVGVAKDLYGVGISVLAIVFAVFVASLAIIMSATDDAFVEFLEQTGDYTTVLNAFRFTLGLLFVALVFGLCLYGYSSVRQDLGIRHQSRYFMAGFIFIFTWGLVASLLATLDSIRYSKARTQFIAVMRHRREEAADCKSRYRGN